MKLIKNTKVVKFPRSTKSVEQTIRTALSTANEQGWNKIVISGQGKDLGGGLYSGVTPLEAIGLLEVAKQFHLRREGV